MTPFKGDLSEPGEGLTEIIDAVKNTGPQLFENQSGSTKPKKRGREIAPSLPLDRKVWLTTRDAANYIGTSIGGLRNRVFRGQLKPHKPFGFLGRSYFKRSDLDRLMERS